MASTVSLGYLTPDPSRITAGPWSLIAGGVIQEQTLHVADWDYAVDLVVQREVVVDLSGLLTDCGLGPDTLIHGLLCWTSSATRLRGGGGPVVLTTGRNVLSLALRGEQLGGDLALDARVVLGPIHEAVNPLAPQRSGNTLWSDTTRIALEGAGARFPTLPIAFSTSGLAGGRNGLWCLTADTDELDASASGSIRLFLNSENENIQKLLAEPTAEQSRILAEVIRSDVARQMLFRALGQAELDLRIDYEPGSVGEVLAGFIRRFFPHRDMNTLRGDMRTIPGDLEAELQAQIGFLA